MKRTPDGLRGIQLAARGQRTPPGRFTRTPSWRPAGPSGGGGGGRAAEASRTLGDTQTRLPRHCGVCGVCGVGELPLPHPTAGASALTAASTAARSRATGRVHALQATEEIKNLVWFNVPQQSQVGVSTDINYLFFFFTDNAAQRLIIK